ncbi:MAG: hypothetical protein WC247_08615 [Porticoccaceae bacterium]|jgi:hypothetical protein
MKWSVISLAMGAVLLQGCYSVHTAQAPVAATYPLTSQQKMQAAHHWDVLAGHQAELLASNQFLRLQPLHIDGGQGGATPFNEAFDALLTSQLVSRGLNVKTGNLNTVNISYKAQLVRHKDRGLMRAPEGTWTALAAGIAVATLPVNNWSEPALALIPVAAAADLFSGGWASRSSHEVIITTQAVDGDRIVFSSSNIYYINAGDKDHYFNTGGKTSVDGNGPFSEGRDVRLTDTW